MKNSGHNIASKGILMWFGLILACQWLSNPVFGECESKLMPFDGAGGHAFGSSIAVSSDLAIVGSPYDDGGSAYIFRFNPKTLEWEQEQKLVASDGSTLDHFGLSVSISGNVAIVGAPRADVNDKIDANEGAAYVFRFDGFAWVEEQKFIPSDPSERNFGISVAISGNVAMVGALLSVEIPSIRDTCCEYCVLECGANILSIPCDYACLVGLADLVADLVGPPDGVGYIYRYDSAISNWIQEQLITPSGAVVNDGFGSSLALSGDVAVIGAPFDATSLPANGTPMGSAFIFRHNGVSWDMEQRLVSSDLANDDAFGGAVAIDGNTAVIGAIGNDVKGSNSGSAYVFQFDGTQWNEVKRLVASDGSSGDNFGISVSVSGNVVAVGAFHDNSNGYRSGSAYLFEFDSTEATWFETHKLDAFDDAALDAYGTSVVVSDNFAIVGAPGDDDNGSNSGSVYVYDLVNADPDCNGNGVCDVYDIASSSSSDCNENLIPDDCDIASGVLPDCNGNSFCDQYDIYTGFSKDCNGNSLPDECDIASGASLDCNSNGIPDECELASGSEFDCNFNGVLDVCDLADSQLDCNGDGVLDECEILENKLLASDGSYYDYFGESVALASAPDGTSVAVIGAYRDDDNGTDAGASYVFRHDGSEWIEEQKLLASDGSANDYFGRSVAISDAPDGTSVAVIGACADDDNGSYSGSAYIFRYNPDTSGWVEEQKLLASDGSANDDFGWSVALSDAPDGTSVAVIGARNGYGNDSQSGSAYIFRYNGSQWVEEQKLLASDGSANDNFGWSVALSDAPEGTSVAVIGAYSDDDNGSSSGSAYIFRYNPDTSGWVEEQKLLASDGSANDNFGWSVALSDAPDGTSVAVIGARNGYGNDSRSGSAYIFRYNGSQWVEEQKLLAPDGEDSDYFGDSVTVDGNIVAVGAYGDDYNAIANSGSAYVYEYDGVNWLWKAPKLLASDGSGGDFFGTSVAISGETVIVGARLDDDNGDSSGSAYIFSPAPDYSCPADLNCDQVVNVDDLLILIAAWGPNTVPADLNTSGNVNVDDLLLLIGAWGPCS